MEYELYPPSDQLKDQVYSYIFLKNVDASISKRILPGGYCFLAFHLGEGGYQVDGLNGCSGSRPRMVIIGQTTQCYTVTSLGTADVFLVLFKPSGLSKFFKVCMPHLTNSDLALDMVIGEKAVELYTQLLDNKEIKSRVAIVEEFLVSMKTNHYVKYENIEAALAYIHFRHGILTVKELTDHLSINERTLQRAFNVIIGLSPKQYSRILRMNYLLKLLASGKVISWIELLHFGGYYDQMHFIKDFKAFTGITPRYYPEMDIINLHKISRSHFFSMDKDFVVTDCIE